MSKSLPPSIAAILADPIHAKAFYQLREELVEKFGEESEMYQSSVAVFASNLRNGGTGHGVPEPYVKFWKMYVTDTILNHISLHKNIAAIKRNGLEPRDPFPRPWAGMKAIFMGEPTDPMYSRSEQAVIEHVKKKGERPILLHIKTRNRLYKSVEPRRTFQVISVDPIRPEEIVDFEELA